MIPNGYLIFEDESFLDSTVAKMNALRKNGQFCDVRLQVTHPILTILFSVSLLDALKDTETRLGEERFIIGRLRIFEWPCAID